MANIPNILFLCTGNSARSLLAEAILNKAAKGRFRGFSAGSKPTGAPHPAGLKLLQARGYDTSDLRSKSWDEFAGPEAPQMDIIVTVCDNAANEPCPYWPGHPASAHWGLPDPAAAEADKADAAFASAYGVLTARIEAFLALDHASLTPQILRQKLDEIGQLAAT